jgi:hypothetical protein
LARKVNDVRPICPSQSSTERKNVVFSTLGAFLAVLGTREGVA